MFAGLFVMNGYLLLLLFLLLLSLFSCYVTAWLLFWSTILPWNFSFDFQYYKTENYIHFHLVINWHVKRLGELFLPAAGADTFNNSMHQYSLHGLQNNAFFTFLIEHNYFLHFYYPIFLNLPKGTAVWLNPA